MANEKKSGKGGRPSSYDKANLEIVRQAAAKGATDVEIADLLSVDVRTLYRWKHEHPEFCQALKIGKDVADDAVEQSLYRRARGYSHPATKVFQHDGKIITADYTEHYPPDTTAGIFWLKNRRPDRWRDKQEIEVTDLISRLDAARKRATRR